MTDEMIKLYKKLDINNKRNEFSSLFQKTDKLLDELLIKEKITKETETKNYDLNSDMNEEEMLLFFYEDLWNIKNKVLSLLISKDR